MQTSPDCRVRQYTRSAIVGPSVEMQPAFSRLHRSPERLKCRGRAAKAARCGFHAVTLMLPACQGRRMVRRKVRRPGGLAQAWRKAGSVGSGGGKVGLEMGMIKALRQHIKNRRTTSFIVSFPKTGRTWLRMMIGRILVEDYGIPESRMLATYKATRAARVGPCIFSHGGPYHLLDDRPFRELSIERGVFANKRVLFLVRDIRDTLVSFYFQQHKREKVFDGDLSSFLRDERFGAPKIIRFYTLWFQARNSVPAFKLIRYEAMRASPVAELMGVVRFLGFDRPSETSVTRAVEYSSFENMRRMEEKGRFSNKMMRPGDPADNESFKVRKGKVGGYAEYLGKEDLAFIDDAISRDGDPACDWYLYDTSTPTDSVG